MNKTTDQILQEFRKKFYIRIGNAFNSNDIEQFIKEALERVREETIEKMKIRNNELNKQLSSFGYKCCPTCGIKLRTNIAKEVI